MGLIFVPFLFNLFLRLTYDYLMSLESPSTHNRSQPHKSEQSRFGLHQTVYETGVKI